MLVCPMATASAPPGAQGLVGAQQTSVFSSETEGSQGFQGPAAAKDTAQIFLCSLLLLLSRFSRVHLFATP